MLLTKSKSPSERRERYLVPSRRRFGSRPKEENGCGQWHRKATFVAGQWMQSVAAKFENRTSKSSEMSVVTLEYSVSI